MIGRRILFAEHCDVVVRAVERGTHEVRHAGVKADVLLIRVFFMKNGRDEPACIAGYGAPALGPDRGAAESCRPHDVVVEPFDARADGGVIDRVLLGSVRYAEAAAEIDELDANSKVLFQLRCEFEHDARGEEKRLRAQLG